MMNTSMFHTTLHSSTSAVQPDLTAQGHVPVYIYIHIDTIVIDLQYRYIAINELFFDRNQLKSEKCGLHSGNCNRGISDIRILIPVEFKFMIILSEINLGSRSYIPVLPVDDLQNPEIYPYRLCPVPRYLNNRYCNIAYATLSDVCV